jgi:hypothetical protein
MPNAIVSRGPHKKGLPPLRGSPKKPLSLFPGMVCPLLLGTPANYRPSPPTFRRVLVDCNLLDFFKRLIAFFAILFPLFSFGPSGALPTYMQLARQCLRFLANLLNPLESAKSA